MAARPLSAFRCSSSLPLQSIFPLLRNAGVPATILDPAVIFSSDQLELAYALAKKSATDGTAVSPRLEMEFMMWLAGTPHAEKAIARVGAKSPEDFVLVVFNEKNSDADSLAEKLGLKKIHKPVGSVAALSFFGVDSAELLYEKMALSRI